jgi:hypothetical protein
LAAKARWGAHLLETPVGINTVAINTRAAR